MARSLGDTLRRVALTLIEHEEDLEQYTESDLEEVEEIIDDLDLRISRMVASAEEAREEEEGYVDQEEDDEEESE